MRMSYVIIDKYYPIWSIDLDEQFSLYSKYVVLYLIVKGK